MSLVDAYNCAYDAQSASCEDWESWFADELEEVEESDIDARIEASEQAGNPVDLVRTMIELGIPHWSHPGWIRDLYEVFRLWSNEGLLIRLKMLSEQLLTSLPARPIDPDIRDYLEAIAGGDFCSAFAGASSFWPQGAEFHLARLDWAVVPYALDCETEYASDGRVWMIQEWGKTA